MISLPNSPAELPSPVAIVAHDAGATNLIVAWGSLIPTPVRICADGPAKKIISRAWPISKFGALEEVVSGANVVLSGTGWGSSLEHDARRYAKSLGIPTLAVIDHWTNYVERFVHEQENVLPDLIVVTDNAAKSEAQRCFDSISIVQWPNSYLDSEVKKIHQLRGGRARTRLTNILMIMEPTRNIWQGDALLGEFVASNYFLSNLQSIGVSPEQVKIRIRPHPSDPLGKYDCIANWYPSILINVSEDTLLADDIAWADMVVGCESFALVVALSAGVPTMSIIPPHAPRCRLPHKTLQHLNNLVS